MSARQRRRLQPKEDQGLTVEEDEIEEPIKPKHSTFSKLQISSDEEEEEEQQQEMEATDIKPIINSKSQSNSKKNKKTSKSNKKDEKSKREIEEDEFLSKITQNQDTPAQEKVEKNRFEFIPDRLDPDREVKRKLGKELFSAPPQQSKEKKVKGRRIIHAPQVVSTSLPRLFVTPEKDWTPPPTFASGEGARMNKLNDHYFTFEASSSFKAAQEHYRELVLTYDPNNLIHLVQEHPFHVDSLLQLHDVFMSSGQNETAQMMLRRALYTLESWCSPQFRTALGGGLYRLQLETHGLSDEDEILKYDLGFDCGLNGALIRALTFSMRLAGRRDCFESAFSLCKLLVSLCPEIDPTFCLLSLDYYAIKNRSLEYVIETHPQTEIQSLPTVCYGVAIALKIATRQPDSIRPRGDADKALEEAINRFPKYAEMVLETANRKIPEDHYINNGQTRRILNRSVSEVETRLCKLAVTRQETLWTEELVAWLFDISNNLNEVKVNIDEKDPKLMARYARCRISDLSDKINLLPREELAQDELERNQHMGRANETFGPPPTPANFALNDALLFLQTLLPWVRLPDRSGEEEDGFE